MVYLGHTLVVSPHTAEIDNKDPHLRNKLNNDDNSDGTSTTFEDPFAVKER